MQTLNIANEAEHTGYIAAHSEIPFNAAVVSLGDERPKHSGIINPPKVGNYPPALTLSPSSDSSTLNEGYYLPPRETCDYYISRFLEDVHSTHWFYSLETFLGRVDRTYAEFATDASSSWMCSLYAIFALGASSFGVEQHGSRSTGMMMLPHDDKSSTDYISLAKQLIPAVYDEADIDSIRGLAILVRDPAVLRSQR